MRRMALFVALLVVLALIATGFVGTATRSEADLTADSVRKISIDGLKALLGKPDVVILDVRTAHDWDDSKTKIKGAIRADYHDAASWVEKYPKDKTIVLYCK